MSLPTPPVPINNGCSAIYKNTLYSYSADAFQSLPLTQGARWSQLSNGISVEGGVCVHATPSDASTPPALYIVGGKANATQDKYQGLQRYRYEDDIWENLELTAPVTQNRLYHNAIYLNASGEILMYAGTQDGSKEHSSQTFTISTQAGHEILAYESIAPPAVSPLLVQWTDTQAAMLGGSESNTRVMVFDPARAWFDSGATLDTPLKYSPAVKVVLINGDDGSKNLYSFDMSVSPNEVNRTILVDDKGAPVSGTKAITARALEDDMMSKRDGLTIADWPAYNSSLAPTATRAEYSIAKDEKGFVVMSGGNADDVLCIFKAKENCWANATALLGQPKIRNSILATSSLTSSASTATPTSSQTGIAAATSSAAAVPATTSTPTVNLTLVAIVLSVVVGVGIILLLILLYLRRRRNQKLYEEAGHQRRASGIPEEKDPMDFADRGISFDTSTRYQRHAQNNSQNSFSSMAILMGKVGGNQPGAIVGRKGGSNASTTSSAFNKKYKNAISNPIPQTTQPAPGPFTRNDKAPPQMTPAPTATPRARPPTTANRQGSTRRSSGWNRYWSGGSALNILGFGTKRTTYGSNASDRESQYSENPPPTRATQESAMVPPLNLGASGRMSQVPSGSPTIAHQAKGYPLVQGQSGQIERSNSLSSVSSYGDNRDAFSSGIPASVNEDQHWTPVGGGGGWGGRAPSSVYTDSNYTQTPPRTTMVEDSRNPVPRFPQPPRYQTPPQQSSDMSWLNLGNSR
jgi:hypothetical protein